MAADAVDAAARDVAGVPASRTEHIPLVGAHAFAEAWETRGRIAREHDLPVARIEHLLHRYGSLTYAVLALAEDRPELLEPLSGAPEYLAVEAVYAALAEGALHLDDILTRRTRISIETVDRGVSAAPAVAELIAPVLGWSADTIAREVEHYRARVDAERQSQRQLDDRTADAARLGAPDVRGADLRIA
jgi:glycerol-3-phosphate dehydrogenase